jgi:hypothetical protein
LGGTCIADDLPGKIDIRALTNRGCAGQARLPLEQKYEAIHRPTTMIEAFVSITEAMLVPKKRFC